MVTSSSNNKIDLVSLDFDAMKSSLRSYLQSQEIFKDYDFAGSNINVLLDVLSYNTYLNSFYLNMVASEMFLDSAQLLPSVISKAKELNYTPRSYKSSVASLNVTFQNTSNVASFVIPANTTFTGRNANGSYNFITRSSAIAYPANNTFTFSSLPVYEGIATTDVFVMNAGIEGQQFILTNPRVDTDTIKVTVSNNEYLNTKTLYNVSNTSNIYFIQATSNGYEIVFGDGVFGHRPNSGETITVAYTVSSGSDGNGCTKFSINTNLGPINGFTTAPTYSLLASTASHNGANNETIESIRFNAPKSYQVQDRAITADDFKFIVLNQFTDIKSCYVYSDNFGTVYISPVTYSGSNLSEAGKSAVVSYLKNKCTMGITPSIIDPNYLYLNISNKIRYNSEKTTKKDSDIMVVAKNAIRDYNDMNLVDFNKTFEMSRFESKINDSDISIITNETVVTMKKIINPLLNTNVTMSINYNNTIIPGSFYSSSFNSGTSTYLYTDFNPDINTFTVNQTNNTVTIENTTNTVYLKNTVENIYTKAGTIDYTSGTIQLNGIIIVSLTESSSLGIVFYASPKNQDVSAKNNDILEIDIANGLDIAVTRV
jgi:hypothetical protein